MSSATKSLGFRATTPVRHFARWVCSRICFASAEGLAQLFVTLHPQFSLDDFIYFNSEADMENYIAEVAYPTPEIGHIYAGLLCLYEIHLIYCCVAVVIDEWDTVLSQFSYKLRFNTSGIIGVISPGSCTWFLILV